MHAIINTYDLGKPELTVMKLIRGDFSIFVYVSMYKQILPHCVAPPKRATLLFFAMPSAVAGRHASRLHRHHIVLRPTAL